MSDLQWTLDELISQVAEALADGYPGAPSARVRDLPDARTIRWYVTRGLVDPPLAMRGRQARYGRRHLLQLVALKRRQAAGVQLAAIQVELAGLPDSALAGIAALPPSTNGSLDRPRDPGAENLPTPAHASLPTPAHADGSVSPHTGGPVSPHTGGSVSPHTGGSVSPHAGGPVPARVPGEAAGDPGPGAAGADRNATGHRPGTARPRLGSAPADTSPRQAPASVSAPPPPDRVRFWAAAPAAAAAAPAAGTAGRDEAADREGPGIDTVHRIRLAPGVVLLVDAEATSTAGTAPPVDVAALRAAAVPLLDLLRPTPNGPGPGPGVRHRPTVDEGTRR